MTEDNRLGDYLRAQRARVTPAEVGLPDVGARRVAGLRREEVAVLAGVSVDYYARLEQGRERTPSAQVMNTICAALMLGADGRAHAYRLARLTSSAAFVVDEAVSTDLQQMMDNVSNAAAYVVNSGFRVLSSNRIATALIGADQYDRPVEYLFLDPAARLYYLDWIVIARATISGLRFSAGFTPTHPEVAPLVEFLRRRSPEFSTLWDAHEVAGLGITKKRIEHPEVGRLDLTYQTFEVRDAPGQQLIVATAPVGSPSADALSLLGSLDATRHR
ncbi:hypothetical protein CH294_06575 [Rhodococcus sp. 14-2483-1-1]|uniref:helix-turn-helix transcriptional regulator n=1 Tax=unclassified Rhodococcus (in: high G+C Gram-positive bacteria) TaxID=192944 RepID=UPI000B9B16D4|nr:MULTISPECIES: helix-turn-helix transcriptional regulator [unclassified Rhodococcus (in: high G+C Gram-positive bacteria)]OZE83916.1 hypothetical protein CH305_05520 [Rhodococcus sp. 15-649-2-2]OZF39151.1 hypothetical protein CH294_06575 [Rhodococcus sp. 14-2483-1-1]